MAFLDPDINPEKAAQAVDLFERIMAEDKVQLANLQRGLQSRFYQTAPLAPSDYEGTVWDFYQYMARTINI